MEEIFSSIEKRLFDMQDLKYRDFQAKLMPGIDKERIIGVRTPMLRKFAKELSKTDEGKVFISRLPHNYYDEYNLHGFILEGIKDYERAVCEVDKFLPYVDNWATCDLVNPKIFKKHTDELMEKILEWTASDRTYTVRYGIGMLLAYYLDDKFKPEQLELAASIKSEEYYINMMIAWYFATALAKQYEAALPFISEKRLDKWVHNKAIQKSVESYRISDENKEILKSYRIKN